MAKYTTLTELAAAFKSGELESKDYFLLLDKGGNDMHLCSYRNDLSDEELDAANDRCRALFDRKYGNPVVELMHLAGVNSEWC